VHQSPALYCVAEFLLEPMDNAMGIASATAAVFPSIES
jgi:hypothetical protein